MADVTINELTKGTPAGSNILPYSTGTDTLGVPVSAIFRSSNLLVNTSAVITSSDEKVSVLGQSSLQNNSNTIAPLYTINNQAGATGIKPYIYLSEAGGNRGMLGINGVDSTFNIGGQLGLNLCTGPNPGTTARLSIDSTGNVGIGTTTPQAKLDVNGSMFNNNLPMYGVRAWVKFVGTKDVNGNASTANTDRQIFASGNVTRVNRWGLGNYDIYLNTPFASTNYSVVANIIHAQGSTTDVHIDAYGQTGGIVRTWCSYQPGTISYDPVGVDVWVIG